MPESKPRLLIIEDDANTLRVYTRLLRPDFVVTAEAEGASALRRVTEGEIFDVVLCDRNLAQGMSGEQFLAALAGRGDMQSRVVICSGQHLEDGDAFGTGLGDRYFVKTEAPALLVALLLRVAGVQRGARAACG